jgi:hypothetical protein
MIINRGLTIANANSHIIKKVIHSGFKSQTDNEGSQIQLLGIRCSLSFMPISIHLQFIFVDREQTLSVHRKFWPLDLTGTPGRHR